MIRIFDKPFRNGALAAATCLLTLAVGGQAAHAREATYNHPELGLVSADHPRFQAAFTTCDKQVYGPGFDIHGVIYRSKSDVFPRFDPCCKKDSARSRISISCCIGQERCNPVSSNALPMRALCGPKADHMGQLHMSVTVRTAAR